MQLTLLLVLSLASSTDQVSLFARSLSLHFQSWSTP
jgi:hypothetical protein